MTRVKRSVHAKKKRRSTLERTKGFRGEANSNYKRAKEALMKAEAYQYRDRRNRKRDFRRLWVTRINAAARQEGMTYSTFSILPGVNGSGLEKLLRNLPRKISPRNNCWNPPMWMPVGLGSGSGKSSG